MRSFLQDSSIVDLSRQLKPEERLLLAVLESAYWDLQSPDPAKQKRARTYFLEEREEHAFSFICICQYFSWSPTSIRYQLNALLESVVPQSPVAARV